jgi:predicted peptidase
VYRTATADITLPGGTALATDKAANLVVDDFRQLEFDDPKIGRKLRYNLFVPRDYDAARSYPLVLFMHDAGATSDVTRTTLFQGLGAVAWARPEEQAHRPCFVLAPQYAEIIADDNSKTSPVLDTTINLVKALSDRYSIDRKRLYTTGQSGGCMMSIAMDIKYPNFFAASLLVAGQWAPELSAPLAGQKLWIIVSQDDDKAYPGQNAITAVLEKNGAHVARAVWDGRWTPTQFRSAAERIEREQAPVNYVAFQKGSVIPPGQSAAGASGHRNTWRIAYTIEPVREWLFRQHR